MGAAGGGKVYEYDADGKTVLEANVLQARPASSVCPTAIRWVACQNQGQVIELDQTGKAVHEMKDLKCHPFRASRR